MKRSSLLASGLAVFIMSAGLLRADDFATVHFKGRVTDSEGRPLAGAKISINRVSGAPIEGDINSLHTLADVAGLFELPLRVRPTDSPIRCELWMANKGYVRARKEVMIQPRDPKVEPLNVTLNPGQVLSGVIRFTFYSQRQIEANPALKETSHLFQVTGKDFNEYYLSEKGGAFEIFVPPGDYRITATLGTQSVELSEVKAGTTSLVLEPQPFVWSEKSVGKVFDDFWQAMDLQYSYFFLKKEVNWNALKKEFRPRAVQAKNAGELAKVLQQMLAPLRDLHVWIETPRGIMPTYSSSYIFNGNGKATRQAILETTQLDKFAVVGKTKEGFGYFLVLNQVNATAENVKLAVAAIKNLRDAPGFIVDLRQANGGNEPLAQEIARLFCAKDTVYAKQKFRNGAGHTNFTEVWERVLKASENPYTKPVVCLIGPGALSSGEGFVKMMKALPQVTTVGMPTRGASANPKPFRLEGTGLAVTFSRWVDLMPDGQTWEGKGIPPEIRVDEPASAYLDRDPTLEKGLEILRQKLKATAAGRL